MIKHHIQHISTSVKRLFVLFVAVASLAGFALLPADTTVLAQEAGEETSAEDLRSRTEQLSEEIEENLDRIQELSQQEGNLEARIEQLDLEVEVAKQQIVEIDGRIDGIDVEIDATQEDLDRQEELLANSVRILYKRGQVSTIELIAGSGSFNDFINEQEYLSRIKIAISDTALEIERLKVALEDRKGEQVALREGQEVQRTLAEQKIVEQEELLEETQGEQERFEEIVEDLRAERIAAQAELDDFLQSLTATGNVVSLGEVKRGDQIGLIGSTGFSTGPHLHLEVHQNNVRQNPVVGPQTLAHGFGWPIPAVTWSSVTQQYGCVGPIGWYAIGGCTNGFSFHPGLDVSAPSGSPLLAMADGDIIFRGWRGGYGNTVIIDHGNGVVATYAHLLQ